MGSKVWFLFLSVAIFCLILITVCVLAEPTIGFGSGTPSSGSFQSDSNIFLNVTASGATLNVSTFIDFDNSLVSWWRMDDINATGDPTDYMGRNNGQKLGNANQTDAGYFGKGFDFLGSGEYIAVPHHDSLNITDEITISYWIYSLVVDEFLYQVHINKGMWDINTQYTMYHRNNDLIFYYAGLDESSSTYNISDAILKDTWQHVVLSFVYGSGSANVYVNGVLQAGNWDVGDGTSYPFTDTNELIICSDTWGGSSFNGTIDDVMIFNRSMSAAEIVSLYANQTSQHLERNFTSLSEGLHSFTTYAQDILGNVSTASERTVTIDTVPPTIDFGIGTPTSGTAQEADSIFVNVTASDATTNISTFIDFDNSLVSWWRFDDLNGTGDPTDYMGRNNGSKQDNAAQTDTGFFGKGFEFDGDGDYIEIQVTQSLNISEAISISLWVKPNKNGIDVIGRSDFNNNQGDWGVWINNNHWYFQLNDGDVIKEDFGSGSIPFGEWVYTVFTYSKTNQTMRIYVNGIESSSQFYNKFINSSYATIGIGAQYGPIGVRTLFNGTIDDVMVFNRSLTATEVAALYANQSTRYLEQNFTSLPNHNYTFKAYTQDRAGNINSTEMRTVTILSTITPPTITAGTVQFILTINNLNNQVYIPGTGIIDSSAIVNTTYTGTSIEHWYVASYLNNILNSLVFIARTPGSIKTERNPTSHIITLSEGMQNSKSLLVFTSGDHNTIENRMELIENEQFLNKISPSFAHGLGLNYVIKILLSYSDIRIMDNMLLGIGYHDIVFKSAGFKEGYISINVSSV